MGNEVKNIESRLLAIQSELKAPKSQYNSFGKYNYRNCEDILEAVKPLCAKHGAVLKLSDNLVQIGERYYITATAMLANIENPSEIISAMAFAREEERKKGMDDSQVTGASSSYARKYALNALFCIDDTKDSDATNTGGGTKSEAKPAENPPGKTDAPSPYLCSDCGKSIRYCKKRDGSIWYAEETNGYSLTRYGRALCVDCMKKVEKEREKAYA